MGRLLHEEGSKSERVSDGEIYEGNVTGTLNKKFRYKRSLAWPLTALVVIQPR